MINSILVGLAGTTYTAVAIQRAVTLAQSHNAEVTGVTILDNSRVRCGGIEMVKAPNRESIRAERMEIARSQIEQPVDDLEAACQTANIKHRIVEESGDAFTALIDQARYYDLMIFGLRSLFEFNLLPDPHNSLVRLVQAGVRPLIAVSKGFFPVKKVLIAYSGSMESAKAMKRFVQMRLWPEAKLRIVTFEHAADRAEQLVRDGADYCRAHGFGPEEAFVPDTARPHLLPYAERWGADLTVVGNSAKHLLLRRIFGETALHAIQNANRPLFVAQ